MSSEIYKAFTFVSISSEEDYETSQKFIDKLPIPIKKIIVVTIKDGETKEVKCLDPFVKVHTYGYKEFSFSEARNYAKSLCETEWVISIDMDEEFHYNQDDLKRIFKAPEEVCGFFTPIMNFSSDGALIKPHIGLRIFRKQFDWRYFVHEDISTDILEKGYKISHTPITLRHFGYDNNNSKKYYSKLERNYLLCTKDCYKNPELKYIRSNMNRITNDMRRWENDNEE